MSLNFIWDKITEWLKGLLVGGIVSNLSGLFDSINTERQHLQYDQKSV